MLLALLLLGQLFLSMPLPPLLLLLLTESSTDTATVSGHKPSQLLMTARSPPTWRALPTSRVLMHTGFLRLLRPAVLTS